MCQKGRKESKLGESGKVRYVSGSVNDCNVVVGSVGSLGTM